MGKAPTLTDIEKGKIDVLLQEEKSHRDIAKLIGRSPTVVNNYVKNKASYGKKKSTGRPKKLSPRDERLVLRKASNSTLSCPQLKSELNLNVSRWTINRTINNSSFIARQKMLAAPALKECHKAARLEFARINMNRDWTAVVFSDEKKWNLDGPDGCHDYWRDLWKEPAIFSTRNFGGGSVMTWAVFCSSGQVDLVFTSSRMNSADYQKVLAEFLLPFLNLNRHRPLIYQQDNASIHGSRSTKEWFAANNVTVLPWPARSPDLNCIENLWGAMVRQVYGNGKQYDTINELKEAIKRVWWNLDPNLMKRLVDSMPNRIFEVISKDGSSTTY